MENQKLGFSMDEAHYLLINRDITRSFYEELTAKVEDQQTKRRCDKCVVFLTTYGGDPHAAYRAGQCLRHTYKYVRIVIPSMCKSAGTLLAICGNELAIGDMGELGPLDIQVRKAEELSERNSGLDIINALFVAHNQTVRIFTDVLQDLRYGAGISTRLASTIAVDMAIGATRPLYEQIDPIRAAEMQRAVTISIEYGYRLNEKGQNLKDGALNNLTTGYPDHGFVIDRKESRSLFKKVTSLSEEEILLFNKYRDLFMNVRTEQEHIGPCFFEKDKDDEEKSEKSEGDGLNAQE